MKNRMIYEYKVHGIYYDEKLEMQSFSLMIDSLEIICELGSGKVMGIGGIFSFNQSC